jgi:penicillin-binding protein 1A
VAFQVTHLLQGVCEPVKDQSYFPSGRRTAPLGRPRAGKTGTTNDAKDLWFCGYTPQYTCIVWIGYDDSRSIGGGVDTTGGALASPIWTEFMIRAHERLPVAKFPEPEGVEWFKINRATGVLGGDYDEAYIRGTRPPTSVPIFSSPERPRPALETPLTFSAFEPR